MHFDGRTQTDVLENRVLTTLPKDFYLQTFKEDHYTLVEVIFHHNEYAKTTFSVEELSFTAFICLLFRYCRQEEIAIHICKNRDTAQISSLYFQYMACISCKEFIQQTTEKLKQNKGTLDHLSNVLVSFGDYSEKSNLQNLHHKQTYELEVLIMQNHTSTQLSILYSKALFSEEKMKNIPGHLQKIMLSLVDDALLVQEIDYVTEEEKNYILHVFNQDKFNSPGLTVHENFEKSVETHHARIALVHNGKKITYGELNQKANKLSKLLRKKGVTNGNIVALLMERSIDSIAVILAIMKAGAAYLPIDVEYPAERVKYIIEDSQPVTIVTTEEFTNLISHEFDIFIFPSIDSVIEISSQVNSVYQCDSKDLVYILYTSGSTGKPKGVLVQHNNVISYVKAFQKEYALTKEDIVLQQATFCFDTFVDEVYPALFLGGRIVIIDKKNLLDKTELQKTIIDNKITIISATPFIIGKLNETTVINSVRTYISGGDVLKKEHITTLMKKATVYNTYGPTETTVCATFFKCTDFDNYATIPLGKPIAGYQVLILDEYGRLSPVGIPGEICICGAGVTRGYLNNAVLTNQKFVQNPYNTKEKMYKTGDIGKWLPDGNIEFIGRIDYQVKIRGYRIEIGEIEANILSYEDIKEVVVVVKSINDLQHLCAYIIADKKLNLANLKKYLLKILPHYMVPTFIMQLDQLPLSYNAKINLQALPDPSEFYHQNNDNNQEFQNDIEKKVFNLWVEVLGYGHFSLKDNFFDIGGNSLNLVSIVDSINMEFKINLTVIEFFDHPNIRLLSNLIITHSQQEVEVKELAKHEKNFLIAKLGKLAEKNRKINFNS